MESVEKKSGAGSKSGPAYQITPVKPPRAANTAFTLALLCGSLLRRLLSCLISRVECVSKLDRVRFATISMMRATQLAVAGRLDDSSARDVINDLLAASGQEALDAMKNKVWCDGWKADKRGAVKQRSPYPQELLATRTVNQTIKLLRGMYQDAVEQGHLGRNPFVGLAPLREESEESSMEPFTPAEVGSLIKEAAGDFRRFRLLPACQLFMSLPILCSRVQSTPAFHGPAAFRSVLELLELGEIAHVHFRARQRKCSLPRLINRPVATTSRSPFAAR